MIFEIKFVFLPQKLKKNSLFYMMNNETFIAKTFLGFEPFLMEELQNLGAKNCKILNRAVYFEGDIRTLYRANYFCRTALRVLWKISEFTFQSNKQFYESIYKLPTEHFLAYDGTLAISANITDTIFKTPLFASMLAKDAICDHFREIYSERPSVDKDNPDVQFHLYVYKNKAEIYLDSSGDSLHKRGYRRSTHPAPLNEVTAAAMIKMSGWNADCDFIDFMCGSGTLLIEAALFALNVPAGFYRKDYGFFHWRNFDRDLWKKVINEAEIKDDVPINFYGADIDSRFLGMARANIEEARLEDFIRLRKCDFRSFMPKTDTLVIINPPYGERLEVEDLGELYKQIGEHLKTNYKGCKAFVISSNADALKKIGLAAYKKKTVFNGALECKVMGYELY